MKPFSEHFELIEFKPHKQTDYFKDQYLGKPDPETLRKSEVAFAALMAYEVNAQKYDQPFGATNIPKGQRMSDYAMTFNTTIAEMKTQWRNVEEVLKRSL